jgi:F-type H+-transporting ATPase subunit epsilon
MPFALSIVTPEGSVFEGEVDGVVLPGAEGDFGVLPDHERFLCPLRIGEVQIQTSGRTTWAAVSSGFADVSGSQVAVMVDACELSGDIDVARAEAALQRAEQALAESKESVEARCEEFESALERARTRIAVSQHS